LTEQRPVWLSLVPPSVTKLLLFTLKSTVLFVWVSWESRRGTPQNKRPTLELLRDRRFHELSGKWSINCFLNVCLKNYFENLPPSEGRVFAWKIPLQGFSLQSLSQGETIQQRCLCTAGTLMR